MRVYAAISLPFLFHMSIISFKSLSVSFSGHSLIVFIKLDRLSSAVTKAIIYFNCMSEKLRSSDAVEMGIDKHMVACLCRLGNNAISMS